MTTILPFPIALTQSPTPASANANTSSDAGDTFAAMLTADTFDRKPDQTFGFAELGMFGLHATQHLIEPQSSIGSATKSPGSSAPRALLASRHSQRAMLARGRESELNDAGVVAVPTSQAAEVQPSPDESRALVSAKLELAAPSLSALSPDESTEAPSSSARAALPEKATVQVMAARATSSVNLVVSGTGETLTITARSQAASADAQLLLRRLLEDAATEYGMGIAEIRLNGISAGPTIRSARGGTHGSRTG